MKKLVLGLCAFLMMSVTSFAVANTDPKAQATQEQKTETLAAKSEPAAEPCMAQCKGAEDSDACNACEEKEMEKSEQQKQ